MRRAVVSDRFPSSPLALLALVTANLVPLVGVVFWGWSLFFLLVAYWLESGVVGLFTVPRILTAAGENERDPTLTVNGRSVSYEPPEEPADGPKIYATNVPLAGFFCVHYGVFWVVHGVFVLTMFGVSGAVGASGAGPASTVATVQAVGVAAVALLVSHAGSFVVNYLKAGEYRTAGATDTMMRPYRRVFVLHLTIIFGGIAIAALGSPIGALVLLVLFKTGFDAVTHLREHRRDRTPADPESADALDATSVDSAAR